MLPSRCTQAKGKAQAVSSRTSERSDDLPVAIAEWLKAHPSRQCRQFGPLPPGWAVPLLDALVALDRLGAEVLLCKFKLGSLRLRVRPEDLASPVRAAQVAEVISKAQDECQGRCTLCGQRISHRCEVIDGARCDVCMTD